MPRDISLKVGYTAFITAIANDPVMHRVILDLKKASGTVVSTVYLRGKGARTYMTTTATDAYVSFGPFFDPMTITVDVDKANATGGYDSLTMFDPTTVTQGDGAAVNITTDTILAQSDKVTKDECLITVAQTKAE